jgi:hypothetical protein
MASGGDDKMKETYQDWKPSKESYRLLSAITEILEYFEDRGYKLTLRQLYYQLVSKDIIPNSVKEYTRIGNVVSRGRLAGLIDWYMIEDRLRIPQSRGHWDSPRQIIETASRTYYRSRWENQRSYIEVWCEKDAVSNIIEPVCDRWDVTFMANRGYSSLSAMYNASQRLKEAHDDGKFVGVIYLGDHDPSGIDMTRDIKDRLGIFLNQGISFNNVDRIALNMDQVDQYKPPENPAKVTDSRFAGYVKIYGYSSWELDALEPSVLDQLVEDKITEFVDRDLWDEVTDLEEEHKERLRKIADEWED